MPVLFLTRRRAMVRGVGSYVKSAERLRKAGRRSQGGAAEELDGPHRRIISTSGTDVGAGQIAAKGGRYDTDASDANGSSAPALLDLAHL
jgi:hypothetical protein